MGYIAVMKRIAPLALIALLAAPVQAEDTPAPDAREGLSLMEEGAKLLLRGLMREVEPAMDDLRGMAEGMEPALRQFVDEMGPAMADIIGKMGDITQYHPPEMLPNGDIILRRKTPLLPEVPEQGEVDL